MAENKAKVKLVGKKNKVIFSVTPGSFSESKTANYDQWNLVHLPVDLYAYRNSSSRSWEIQAILVSRTVQEAEANSKILNTIRSWSLPDFGNRGAPPDILKLSAFGDPNIDNVTCILRSHNWNYPAEVDYVYMAAHKMPIIGTLGLSLTEIYSAQQIQDGDWKIKETGTITINNPDGFGKTNINSTVPKVKWPDVKPLGLPLTSGDPLNIVNNILRLSPGETITDVLSGQPYIPGFLDFGEAPDGFSPAQDVFSPDPNGSI